MGTGRGRGRRRGGRRARGGHGTALAGRVLARHRGARPVRTRQLGDRPASRRHGERGGLDARGAGERRVCRRRGDLPGHVSRRPSRGGAARDPAARPTGRRAPRAWFNDLAGPPGGGAGAVRRLDEAEVELDRVEDLAHRRQHPSRIAAAARLRGQLAEARRDRHLARAKLEEAVALGNDARGRRRARDGTPGLRDLPAASRRTTRRDRTSPASAAPLQRARRGPVPEPGRRGPCCLRRPTASVHNRQDPLTPQERAVARLVASGRTNQQAADELVVSVSNT